MTGETVGWHDLVIAALKENNVRLVVYVPDNVLRPLIEGIHADPYFTCFPVAREEEGLGIVCGSWMAGKRGVLLMQTSGFATLAIVLLVYFGNVKFKGGLPGGMVPMRTPVTRALPSGGRADPRGRPAPAPGS